MSIAFATPVIPDHVPENLIRPFPFVFGTITEADPFNEWVPEVHKGPDIFWTPHAYPGGTPAWIVRRTQDLRDLYFDTENFSSKDFSPYSKMKHAMYRAFVNPIFTPKAMAALEEKIRSYAVEYIEAFRAKGECEYMKDFAFEFPIKVFLELMGLPLSLTPQFLEWETGLLHEPDMGKMAAAARSVVDYLRGEIEDRRKNPTGDIISYAVQAQIDGGRKLDDDELVGFCFNLFIGGLDTVSTNMGGQFAHLATHPEDQARLRANPEMIPTAIDEMMRAYAAVTTFRTCTREVEFKGVRMMPGDKVAVCTTLGGRDPEEYDRANDVIIDRKPKHVSFGYGPHLCVGMHLARREMRIAMEEFLARIPAFTLKPGHTLRRHLGMIQPVELPLVWQA